MNRSVSGSMSGHVPGARAAAAATARPICFLVLDVVATLIGLDRALGPGREGSKSEESWALERAVGLALGEPGSEPVHEIGFRSGSGEGEAETPRRRTEETDESMSLARRYWEHVLFMMSSF